MSTDKRLGGLREALESKESRPRLANTGKAAVSTPKSTRDAPAVRKSTERRKSEESSKQSKWGRAESRSAAVPRVRVVVRLDPVLRDTLASTARGRNLPLAAVVFEAIEQAHGNGALARAVAEVGEGEESSGLFSQPKLQMAQAKTTLELRMIQSDLATLDRLVEQYGAASRTQLITLALREIG